MIKLATAKAKARRDGWSKWIKSEADERAAMNGCRFNAALGEHVAEFFSTYLRHSTGQWHGKPFELMPWQRDEVIMPLFSWVRPDGLRRFRKAYIEVPKKNGKSCLAAGVGLYMLIADGERRATICSAAVDREQASIIHDEAVNMVHASPELRAALKVNRSTNTIYHPESLSSYKAYSRESGSKEGQNLHCCLIDELHVWRGSKLWDSLRWAFIAREQPLLFIITTAGDDMQSVCRQQHEYARRVLSGTAEDEQQLSYIRCADPDDDWTKPKVWKKANPSLGIIIDQDQFAADVREARETPASEASFKRRRLNIWSTGINPWLSHESWAACQGDFTAEDLEGKPCWVGLDLARTRDTSALLLVFPGEGEGAPIRVLSHFWMPEGAAKKGDDLAPYLQWATGGYLRLTPGDYVDYGVIESDIIGFAERFNIFDAGCDPTYASQLMQRLHQQIGLEWTKFAQTALNFAAPTAELERLVLAGGIEHDGNPLLSWQMGNATIREDANANKRPVKPPGDDHRKIDGVVALIMALGRLQVADGRPTESAYEKRGFLVF